MRPRGVIKTVEEHLLTPRGLRTLSPEDPAFRGMYEGDGDQRDSAYHQGTVWPWLFGVYVEAALKWAENPVEKGKTLRKNLSAFLEEHLYQDCLGLISEIFDGMAPDRGKGAFGMAWCHGEMIRAFALLDKTKK